MKRFLLLVFLVLIFRILLLPFTSVTNEGDSVARIFLAWQWMEHPKFLTHGGWGPLHFYLIAAALRVWFDPVFSPSFLHILISVATAIPLRAFVRREWGEPGATFAAAAFLFYPLSFRLSFLPASEVPFVFFVVLAMYFISRARSEETTMDAILAGFSMTLASALRVEAWLLIILFSFLFWRKWRLFLVYFISASIFPLFWMIENVIHGFDPISQLTDAKNWQLKAEGINENLNASEVIRRLVYFPFVVVFGLTPPISILCLAGVYFVWRDRAKRLWLIPIAVLLPFFMVRAAQGLVTTQARYSLLLGCLLIPFSAVTINHFKAKKWITVAAIVCIVCMIPLSYSRVILYRVAGSTTIPNPFPADLEAIPRIHHQTKEIARIVAENLKRDDGLLIDFFGKDFYGWKDTFYVALMSRIHPSRLLIMPGARHQPLVLSELTKFIQQNPTGLLLRSDDSRFIQLEKTGAGEVVRIAGYDDPLFIQKIASVKSITIYRYQVH